MAATGSTGEGVEGVGVAIPEGVIFLRGRGPTSKHERGNKDVEGGKRQAAGAHFMSIHAQTGASGQSPPPTVALGKTPTWTELPVQSPLSKASNWAGVYRSLTPAVRIAPAAAAAEAVLTHRIATALTRAVAPTQH